MEEKALPGQLNFEDSVYGSTGTEVKVSGDRVVYAVFIPPTSTTHCPAA
ncbi:hypothetical protein [Streptomyces lavendulae]